MCNLKHLLQALNQLNGGAFNLWDVDLELENLEFHLFRGFQLRARF